MPKICIVTEPTLHYIAHDLTETWVDDWAGHGLEDIEALLAKHAAFLSFLDDQDA